MYDLQRLKHFYLLDEINLLLKKITNHGTSFSQSPEWKGTGGLRWAATGTGGLRWATQ
jgi:hypothetical protein